MTPTPKIKQKLEEQEPPEEPGGKSLLQIACLLGRLVAHENSIINLTGDEDEETPTH